MMLTNIKKSELRPGNIIVYENSISIGVILGVNRKYLDIYWIIADNRDTDLGSKISVCRRVKNFEISYQFRRFKYSII